jgi:exodeoxyribonuclease V gamma subunit
VSRNLPGSLTGVNRDKAQQKDFLTGFLDALVLSLVDERDWEAFQVHVLTGPGTKPRETERRLRGIERASARQYLTGLLSEMLGEAHDYLLPCEAVFDALGGAASLAANIEAMKESDNKACSSRWGPVPDFTRYEPPDEPTAQAMIERRFGLFRDCGGLDA